MICPVCNRCPFEKGVCEDRVNRGRRFFLMGALALPVARKLEALAPVAASQVGMMVPMPPAGYWRLSMPDGRTYELQNMASNAQFTWNAESRMWLEHTTESGA